MGRHSADDGAGVDPLVAAALAQRPAGGPGVPRHGAGEPRHDARHESGQQMLLTAGEGEGDGDLGWPGDPADGTGLGWPVDQAVDSPAADGRPVTLVPDVTPARRSRWRRLFLGSSAA